MSGLTVLTSPRTACRPYACRQQPTALTCPSLTNALFLSHQVGLCSTFRHICDRGVRFQKDHPEVSTYARLWSSEYPPCWIFSTCLSSSASCSFVIRSIMSPIALVRFANQPTVRVEASSTPRSLAISLNTSSRRSFHRMSVRLTIRRHFCFPPR